MPKCKVQIEFICDFPENFDEEGGESDRLVNGVLEYFDSISDDFAISKDIGFFIKELDLEEIREENKKIDISKMN